MPLGMGEFAKIEAKVLNLIRIEMIELNRVGELELYLKELKIYDKIIGKETEIDEVELLEGNIAVIGGSKARENNLLGIAKDLGFKKEQFEFCLNYEDVKKYNFNKLKNPKYSLVLVGPMPHKQRGVGNYSSMIEKLKSEEGYPQIKRLHNGQELSISNSSFRVALEGILDE